jgi:hypothetical protein
VDRRYAQGVEGGNSAVTEELLHTFQEAITVACEFTYLSEWLSTVHCSSSFIISVHKLARKILRMLAKVNLWVEGAIVPQLPPIQSRVHFEGQVSMCIDLPIWTIFPL